MSLHRSYRHGGPLAVVDPQRHAELGGEAFEADQPPVAGFYSRIALVREIVETEPPIVEPGNPAPLATFGESQRPPCAKR